MKLFYTPEAPSGTADLIASRSPPGQSIFVVGLGVKRTRYKKQCNHIAKKGRKRNPKIKKMIGELAGKC